MTIKFDVKINTNLELIKDIQDLINKHKDNIENVNTQYVQSDKMLWQVAIQFHPVWVDMEDEEKDIEIARQRLIKDGVLMDGSKHCGQG